MSGRGAPLEEPLLNPDEEVGNGHPHQVDQTDNRVSLNHDPQRFVEGFPQDEVEEEEEEEEEEDDAEYTGPNTEDKSKMWVIYLVTVAFCELIVSWVVAFVLLSEKNQHAQYVNGESLTRNTTIGLSSGRAGLSLSHEFLLLLCGALFTLIKFCVIAWAFIIAPCTGAAPVRADAVRDAFSQKLFGYVDLSTLACVLLDIVCFSYPNAAKTVWRGLTMVIRVLFLLRTRALSPPKALTYLDGHDKTPEDKFHRMHLLHTLRELEVGTRRHRETHFLFGAWLWMAIFTLDLGLFFYQTGSQVGGFFTPAILDEMNNQAAIHQYFGDTPLARQRVVIALLDGFRYDHTQINEDFKQFLESDMMMNDSKLLSIKAQLPSMSVPNWVVTLTGVKPEISGVLGNVNIPEVAFDSIYAQAQSMKDEKDPNAYFMRGVVGSPWMGGIVESKLPGLEGDVRVSTDFEADGRPDTANMSDVRRSSITNYALARNESAYRVWLVHFSDIDQQGHYHGVTEKYNSDNTYYKAVSQKTKHLQSMMQKIVNHPEYGDNTIVFITADHGHVDPGGHGGIAPVMRDIPLVIWKKNSGLRTAVYDGPGYPEGNPANLKLQQVENTFIAPTVCALLGIPVPRQNQGQFINDLMPFMNTTDVRRHVEDLYRQKQLFVGKFLVEAGVKDDELKAFAESKLFSTKEADYSSYSIQDLIKNTNSILEIYESHRGDAMNQLIARNFVVAILLSAVLMCVFMHLLIKKTLAFFLPVFRILYGKAYDRLEVTGYNKVVLDFNRLAFRDAFLATFAYVLFVTVMYNIVYSILGYGAWDSTVIHHPHVLPTFAAICLIPGIIAQLALLRILYWHFLRGPSSPFSSTTRHGTTTSHRGTATATEGRAPIIIDNVGLSTPARSRQSSHHTGGVARVKHVRGFGEKLLCFECLMRKPTAVKGDSLKAYVGTVNDNADSVPKHLSKGVGYSYLVRTYLIILGLAVTFFLVIAQSAYGFIAPNIYDVGLLNELTWVVRFRVLTLQIMMLPFLIGNLFFASLGPPFNRFSPLHDELLYFFLVKNHIIFQILGKGADGYEQFQTDWSVALELLRNSDLRSINNRHWEVQQQSSHQKVQFRI